MRYTLRHARLLAALSFALLLALLAGALPSRPALAATIVETTILAFADARTQGGSPDANFDDGFLYVATLNGHISFVRFDLSVLPLGATIEAARLELNAPTQNDGPNNVELGRIDADWSDDTLTWNNQPAITWGGPVTNVAGPTLATWDVTAQVRRWHSGADPSYGFALRGDGGEPLSFDSVEVGVDPTLAIRYRVGPSEGAQPDFGDAPDSSNSVGVNPNTAYPGVPGNFPTAHSGTPAGQPAGPRHNNLQLVAILGDALSRELGADSGNDEDGRNNIVDGGADNANNDRGDDGWRNRDAPFRPCRSTTLLVRVRKPAAAELRRMFLNVWFDGNRDGDWADQALCTPPEEELNIPATEWIVQDYFVDLASIPDGGFVDISVPTETVLNTTPGQHHWMRFTLSEDRAVQFAPGRADGRGPHPDDPKNAFRFGETEDYLQRPPARGETGTLEIFKRVITPNQPVPYGGTVTYEIRLRHVGGTEPVEAGIRDVIAWPQHPVPNSSGQLISVTSATGGAMPLVASVNIELPQGGQPPQWVLSWNGTLAPNAQVTLRFDMHVHPLCAVNEQTKVLANTARAKPVGGQIISAEASFEAACPGYDASDLEIEWGDSVPVQIDWLDATSIPLEARLHNPLPVSVTVGLGLKRTSLDPTTAAIALPSFNLITLGPGERRELSLSLPVKAPGEAFPASDPSELVRLQLCLVPGEGERCADQNAFPHTWQESAPITVTRRASDLGDAPDSTNHAGVAMAAYPGVQANFPTVFDPATGLPEGPRHLNPRPFHLGERVSREAEADIGPDQDPDNNIEPAANTADLDRADDGSRLVNLAHCQPATAEVLVAVSQQAWNWFKSRERPAYLNVWIDSNRDGDWADGGTCQDAQGQQQNVVEHILIDAPIDVVALGPGLHALSLPTARVGWPANLAERPSWVRFTLSERPSNKTLSFNGIDYGDGRGHPQPFQTGETEDHVQRAMADGPDTALRLQGRVRPGGAGNGQIVFKLDYANQGASPADAALITFSTPEQLRGQAPALLQAPGIPAASITQGPETIRFALPSLPAGATSSITLGWALPQTGATQDEYAAAALVELNGDTDPSDNRASVRVRGARRAPIVAAIAGDGTNWGRADTTCRNSVELVGRGEPNSIIAILIGLVQAGTVTTDATGDFRFSLSNLPEGRQRISAVYAITSPRDANSGLILDVDGGLPVDPLSLSLTDSKGRTLHPPTLGWANGTAETSALLRAGETYAVGIDSCVNDPNQRITLSLGDTSLTLRDEDGDGRYTGSVSLAAGAALAASGQLRLTASSGASKVTLGGPLGSLEPVAVRDGASAAPVAGATVTALGAQALEDGGLSFTPWSAQALGEPNPQTTGGDGSFSLFAPGEGRVEISAPGYQLYRSWSGLPTTIRLTPQPVGAPTHTVLITADGFVPAVLRVAPGSTVAWVNVDVSEHSATGDSWDSGALAPGEQFLAVMGTAGTYAYGDAADPQARGTLVVGPDDPRGFRVNLPLLRR
jgi:plastocyanin